jgi:hypothetical protein
MPLESKRDPDFDARWIAWLARAPLTIVWGVGV